MSIMTEEVDELLSKIYYDPVTGYTGIDPLVAAVKRKAIPRSVVTEWLGKQDSFTLHRPAVDHFTRNKTLSKGIDYIWQSDLVDIQPLAKENKGYRYLITIVDTFSRYAWVRPLKNKTGPSVVEALRDVIETSGRKPKKLCTDMGKEYLNHNVKSFLNEQDIIHYSVASDKKAAIAERFNRTLKEKMWRYFTFSKSKKYVDVLQQLVDGYNKRKHRSLGMAPEKVSEQNEQKLWQKQYGNELENKKTPKFKAGQLVRLSNFKEAFRKGYKGNWTREKFQIGQVHTGLKQPMYDIIDPHDGEYIKGRFYEQQLQLVK